MPESTAQLYTGPQYAGPPDGGPGDAGPRDGAQHGGPLHAVAQHALASSGVYALRELTVEPHNDGLLLSGAVSSFYLKQLAQEVVLAAAGAVELVNSVRVTENDHRSNL